MELTKQGTTFVADKWTIIEPSNDRFTADDMIDAYFKGRDDVSKQTQKAMEKLLLDNINKTASYRNDLLIFLKDNKFNPFVSYMKIVSWDTFEILFTVPEEELLDDKFVKVYDFVSELEKKAKNDLNIFFSFTNSSKEFDENQLESDDFMFKFVFN